MTSQDLSKEARRQQKHLRKQEKQRNKLSKSNLDIGQDPLTVLCVKFGNKYGTLYVERLRNMISRHLTAPYEFVCLTDDPTPIKNVRSIVQRNSGYNKGWWHKVHMFDPSLDLSSRILYFDLDVIIFNNIDKLASFRSSEFVGTRDFNRKFYPTWNKLNSSVLAWNRGTQDHIWKNFVSNPANALRMHGDQDWIFKQAATQLKYFPDNWIQSYKWEIRSKQELMMQGGKRRFKDVKNKVTTPPDCSVAVFHGDPNPESVQDPFVIENWQ